MDAAVYLCAGSGGGAVVASASRVSKPIEPRADRRERAHKAAGAQQLPPPAAAGSQIAVELFLIHLVAMQQPVLHPRVEHTLLDVLAQDPGALLITAAEQVPAMMPAIGIIRRHLVFAGVVLPMCH